MQASEVTCVWGIVRMLGHLGQKQYWRPGGGAPRCGLKYRGDGLEGPCIPLGLGLGKLD